MQTDSTPPDAVSPENHEENLNRVRERQERRRQRQQSASMAAPATGQTRPVRTTRWRLPRFQIPFSPTLLLIPLGGVAILIVIALIGGLKGPEETTSPNAIWLDPSWSYEARPEADFANLADTLERARIGTAYLYVGSLMADLNWSGGSGRQTRYAMAEPQIRDTIANLRAADPDLRLLAWIEILAEDADGYRLDDDAVTSAVVRFAQQVQGLGMEGILVDVKPIFSGPDENYLSLLRQLRASLGLETTIAVTVPPDLAPANTELILPTGLAQTEWDTQDKQRVGIQADEVVVTTFHSYQSDPIAYIQWVEYQTVAWAEALADAEVDTRILISVPAYRTDRPAHDAAVETIDTALQGFALGVANAGEAAASLQGIAVFTDHDLTPAEVERIHEGLRQIPDAWAG
jgi:hypothetical protein